MGMPSEMASGLGLRCGTCDCCCDWRLDELFGDSWDVVINAAAVCNFDACERDPLATARVNHAAPLDLARRCASQNAVFVQYSSDYIFEGSGFVRAAWYFGFRGSTGSAVKLS